MTHATTSNPPDALPVFYSDRMVADIASFSPSAGKPREVMRSWRGLGLPLHIVAPEPVSVDQFCLVHERSYVADILACRANNGFGNKSPAVADTLPWTSGAMLSAAREAINNGCVAVAPCSGFHHAAYSAGGGFCTFNGLTVTAAALLRDENAVHVGILDCDTHYGDGTDSIIRALKAGASGYLVKRLASDKLLAFGHPMMNGGIESLPTAVGRVHWILATQNRSFKIGEAARSLGALVNDRQAAIVVDSSAKAPTFPVRVEIAGVPGAPHPVWNMEVAHDQFMAPAFTAMAIGSAVETTTSERRDMTWRATSKLTVGKFGTITLHDFGAGNGNPLGADDFVRGRLVRAVGALLNNPWEPVTIERIDTKIEVTFARETYALRGTRLIDAEVDAGQPVRIRLDLQPYQGKVESRVIEVKVPAELAGREVEIELAPGYDVERPLPTPDSVAELVSQLPSQSFDPESIVATFKLRENGAAYHGKLASRLPPGALDTLRPSTQSDAPETFAAQVQTAIPIGRFLVGRDSVRVSVRSILR